MYKHPAELSDPIPGQPKAVQLDLELCHRPFPLSRAFTRKERKESS